jgi:hypothetical protein
LEDRCQAYQNAILDHGLVVRGEETNEWRRGFDDPRFKTFFSKHIQTELTGQQISTNESEFTLLHVQLRQIQKEYQERQLDLDAQFAEIEQNLNLKTKLVEQLTKQLEISARDSQLIEEHRQKERDYYKERCVFWLYQFKYLILELNNYRSSWKDFRAFKWKLNVFNK